LLSVVEPLALKTVDMTEHTKAVHSYFRNDS